MKQKSEKCKKATKQFLKGIMALSLRAEIIRYCFEHDEEFKRTFKQLLKEYDDFIKAEEKLQQKLESEEDLTKEEQELKNTSPAVGLFVRKFFALETDEEKFIFVFDQLIQNFAQQNLKKSYEWPALIEWYFSDDIQQNPQFQAIDIKQLAKRYGIEYNDDLEAEVKSLAEDDSKVVEAILAELTLSTSSQDPNILIEAFLDLSSVYNKTTKSDLFIRTLLEKSFSQFQMVITSQLPASTTEATKQHDTAKLAYNASVKSITNLFNEVSLHPKSNDLKLTPMQKFKIRESFRKALKEDNALTPIILLTCLDLQDVAEIEAESKSSLRWFKEKLYKICYRIWQEASKKGDEKIVELKKNIETIKNCMPPDIKKSLDVEKKELLEKERGKKSK